jgi:uncharacterized protein
MFLVKCSENFFIMGEESGYAGGIISSVADGIKAAVGFAATTK